MMMMIRPFRWGSLQLMLHRLRFILSFEMADELIPLRKGVSQILVYYSGWPRYRQFYSSFCHAELDDQMPDFPTVKEDL